MFHKKVTLSREFTSESEYNHFESVYKSAPNAFENAWKKEVEDVTIGEAVKNVGEAVVDAVEKIADKVVDLIDGDEKKEAPAGNDTAAESAKTDIAVDSAPESPANSPTPGADQPAEKVA